MGTSSSKPSQQVENPSTQQRSNDDDESAGALDDGTISVDAGSFVFIDREWSCSISSAEDVLMIDSKYFDTSNEPKETNSADGVKEHEQEGTSNEVNPAQCSPKENTETNQDSGEDGGGIEFRKKSDPIDISNPCSTVKEISVQQKSNTEILVKSSVDNFISPDIFLTGKEEWIQVEGCDSTLLDIYEIFSAYGSISALSKTKEHIYVKFSSWAGIANVFDDIRNIKQQHQINSIIKVEEDELKNHPGRTEIYLDLPSFVVAYLKEHQELSKALMVVTMTANDNTCFNAPKIQQVLEHIRKNVIKGFQQCRLFPFGCHILGSCDRFAPLEIFVDVGDMYAGCHKQSNEDQIAIAKEIRKLILENVVWLDNEESPIAVFYHKTVGLKCILNFNNGFGDRCTRLLRVFMDYDERYRILYFMLDIWSKQCSLQGVSNGLNSYIVAVLLVFYLQVRPIPLLPPIQRIRTGRSVIVKGWDCTFIEDASLLPRNECSTELYSLLRGFFVFYGSYDWKRVVCPVLGLSIDRDIFSNPSVPFPQDPILANYLRAIAEKVPNTPSFEISTSMCVQDFFNLSENIAKGVSADVLLRFQSLCRQSHKIIFTAESKMSFGSHVLHHERLDYASSAPYHVFNMQMRDQQKNKFGHRHQFGSVSDCTTSSRSWEPSSNLDHPSEHEHRMYCFCDGCAWANRRENAPEDWQQHFNTQSLQRRVHYANFDENARKQSNGTFKSRGKKAKDSYAISRLYRGRVFYGQKTGSSYEN